jgi:RNA polymerase sigma factor for flagellar operon FliA
LENQREAPNVVVTKWSVGVVMTESKEAEVVRRQALVCQHLEVARNIAGKLARRYSAFAAEDINGPAMVGLCEAAARFDTTRVEPFVAFAEQRIRGAVLDELRRSGLHGRVTHTRQREISSARRELSQTGCEPTDELVAEHLGVAITVVQTAGEPPVHVDEVDTLSSPGASPEGQLACAELLAELAQARAALPVHEATIINLRYDLGLSLAEIARTLCVTVDRVKRLHSMGVARLRLCLADTGSQPMRRS